MALAGSFSGTAFFFSLAHEAITLFPLCIYGRTTILLTYVLYSTVFAVFLCLLIPLSSLKSISFFSNLLSSIFYSSRRASNQPMMMNGIPVSNRNYVEQYYKVLRLLPFPQYKLYSIIAKLIFLFPPFSRSLLCGKFSNCGRCPSAKWAGVSPLPIIIIIIPFVPFLSFHFNNIIIY